MSISVNTNRYRGIPEPLPEINALYNTVAAMQEVIETLTRQRGTIADSAVTVEDLVGLGIIKRSDITGAYRRST